MTAIIYAAFYNLNTDHTYLLQNIPQIPPLFSLDKHFHFTNCLTYITHTRVMLNDADDINNEEDDNKT